MISSSGSRSSQQGVFLCSRASPGVPHRRPQRPGTSSGITIIASFDNIPLLRTTLKPDAISTGAVGRPRLLNGQQSLVESHPEVAAQWNYSLNGKWTPDQLSAGSREGVWWDCPVECSGCGKPHDSWIATVNNCTRRNRSDTLSTCLNWDKIRHPSIKD